MQPDKASVTMQAVCAAKASIDELRLDDPICAQLVARLPEAKDHLAMMNQFTNGLFSQTIYFRKKHFALQLEQHVNECEQLLVLCNGLDFASLAHPAWQKKPIYFVDHPMSLKLSQSLLSDAEINTQHANFIGVDLSTQDAAQTLFAQLSEAKFDVTKSTLLIWEGASYYFNQAKVLELLKMLAHTLSNLTLAFDFVYDTDNTGVSSEERSGREASLEYVKKQNEPWQSKFDEQFLSLKLQQFGFDTVLIESDEVLIKRFGFELTQYNKMFGFALASKQAS